MEANKTTIQQAGITIKQAILQSQLRMARMGNQEQLALYYGIGQIFMSSGVFSSANRQPRLTEFILVSAPKSEVFAEITLESLYTMRSQF